MIINIFLWLFLAAAGLLWLSVFGYLFILLLLVPKNRQSQKEIIDWPEIAVVIAALNEEEYIKQKLQNLLEIDYPPDRIHTVVIDGGSEDETVNLVQKEIDKGQKIQLIRMEEAEGKSDQINKALDILSQEFLVFTDADTTLDPSCIKELIRELKSDPQTAIAGALIIPKSRLPEERIHWRFLNYLWWLEGEVLSLAGLSGVCYAARRKSLSPIKHNVIADDMYLALNTSFKGFHVRVCRKARAYELRVPQSSSQMVQLRRKRGRNYLDELKRIATQKKAPFQKQAARWIRLWHFTVSPVIVVLLFLLGLSLLVFSQWPFVLFTFLVFNLSALVVLYSIHRRIGDGLGWIKLVLASFKLFFVTLLSMLTLKKRSAP